MMYLIYGAVGMLAVLVLLACGFFAGWYANHAFVRYSRKHQVEMATHEEQMQLMAQQRAFESMLNYNQDTAYGINRTEGDDRF